MQTTPGAGSLRTGVLGFASSDNLIVRSVRHAHLA